jgi:hypothetical protein
MKTSYYETNKEKILLKKKQYYLLKKPEILEKRKDYHQQNKEKISIRNKKYNLENKEKVQLRRKQYYIRNRQHIINRNVNYELKRIKYDVNYKLRKRLRCRIKMAIKRDYKKGMSINLLGCSIDEFRRYLEDKFLPGMTWNNYGEWHIDHILPCSRFDLTQSTEQAKCFHYTNQQPLWKLDNWKKGNNVK